MKAKQLDDLAARASDLTADFRAATNKALTSSVLDGDLSFVDALNVAMTAHTYELIALARESGVIDADILRGVQKSLNDTRPLPPKESAE